MILLLDNYDSFVFNLARYLEELGFAAVVERSDAISVEDVASLHPSHVILSPGPCTPAQSGICVEVVRRLGADIPILGVCLGHQCIGVAYGGRVARAKRPMHGKVAAVVHDGEGVLSGIPSPFLATRYHSLVVDQESCPDELKVTALSGEGEIMALEHREHPVFGVQFHPESVATEWGYRILANFMGLPLSGSVPALADLGRASGAPAR